MIKFLLLSKNILMILFILFLIDLLKPLGAALTVEFLLLGVIFVSLNKKGWEPVVMSLLFGYLKDLFVIGSKPFYLIELPVICFFSRYLLTHFAFISLDSKHLTGFSGKEFYARAAKSVIVVVCLFIHVCFNSVYSRIFLAYFSFNFIIQSLLAYFLLNHLLNKDAAPTPLETVKHSRF
ncbi:MAG: hypothetical protein ABIH08_00790 [Candidatus Omnitrophota bacterium]